jgi:hypothetical protein
VGELGARGGGIERDRARQGGIGPRSAGRQLLAEARWEDVSRVEGGWPPAGAGFLGGGAAGGIGAPGGRIWAERARPVDVWTAGHWPEHRCVMRGARERSREPPVFFGIPLFVSLFGSIHRDAGESVMRGFGRRTFGNSVNDG